MKKTLLEELTDLIPLQENVDRDLDAAAKELDKRARKLEKQTPVLMQKWIDAAVQAAALRRGIDGISISSDDLEFAFSSITGDELEDADVATMVRFGVSVGKDSAAEFVRDKETEFFVSQKELQEAFQKAVQRIKL